MRNLQLRRITVPSFNHSFILFIHSIHSFYSFYANLELNAELNAVPFFGTAKSGRRMFALRIACGRGSIQWYRGDFCRNIFQGETNLPGIRLFGRGPKSPSLHAVFVSLWKRATNKYLMIWKPKGQFK
jgi:hypothetical protein